MPRQQGFTLIELMIVVAIITAIAAFALPAYNEYTTRAKIQEATAGLSQWRSRMEQYYLDNRRYSASAGSGATDCGATAPAGDATKYFTFTCASANGNTAGAQTYTLTATGKTGMDNFVFTVDQAGTKRTTGVPSDWTAPSTDCWVQKKTGTC